MQKPMSRTMGRTLAVDYGHARIGIAISDPLGITGQAAETISGSASPEKAALLLTRQIALLEQKNGWTIQTVVIGLPLHLSGKESPRSGEARALAAFLEKSLPEKQILLFDERFTSTQADRAMKETGNLSRKERSKKVDSVSAVILLQSYLDKKSLEQTGSAT